MTTSEKIKVMEAFDRGFEIKCIHKASGVENVWSKESKQELVWDWKACDYSVVGSAEYIPYSYEDDLIGRVFMAENERMMVTRQNGYGVFNGADFYSYEDILNFINEDGSTFGRKVTVVTVD